MFGPEFTTKLTNPGRWHQFSNENRIALFHPLAQPYCCTLGDQAKDQATAYAHACGAIADNT
jgi:hypothetical protein